MITVVVPHQAPQAEPYLKKCLWALSKSRDVEFQVLVVSGVPVDTLMPDSRFHYVYDPTAVGVAAKLELIKDHFIGSSHIALVCDDVMVSQYTLSDMARAMAGREMIMIPMSNSDCASLYEADLYLSFDGVSKKLYPDMDIDDFGVSSTVDNNSVDQAITLFPRRNKCLVPFPTLSFFCVMFPVTVWDKLGNLDPNLEYRHNDQDYCLRAYKQGIPSVVNFGAFVFHFGSRSMKHLANDELKAKCSEYFRKKWNP